MGPEGIRPACSCWQTPKTVLHHRCGYSRPPRCQPTCVTSWSDPPRSSGDTAAGSWPPTLARWMGLEPLVHLPGNAPVLAPPQAPGIDTRVNDLRLAVTPRLNNPDVGQGTA